VGGSGALGQLTQDVPAVDVGHHHVEGDDIRLGLGGQAQGGIAILRMQDLVAMGREVAFEELVDGRVVVDDQHTGLADLGKVKDGAHAGRWGRLGGQHAALLPHEEPRRLPAFIRRIQAGAFQGQVDPGGCRAGADDHRRAWAATGQQAQHLEERLPGEGRVGQHRWQRCGDLDLHRCPALGQEGLQHPEGLIDERLDFYGLSAELPPVEFLAQVCSLADIWRPIAPGVALLPEQGGHSIEPFAQFALQLAEAQAQVIGRLTHAHALDVAVAQRQVAAPGRRTGGRPGLRAQGLDCILEHAAQPLGAAEAIRCGARGDLGQQGVHFQVGRVVEVLQGVPDLSGELIGFHRGRPFLRVGVSLAPACRSGRWYSPTMGMIDVHSIIGDGDCQRRKG